MSTCKFQKYSNLMNFIVRNSGAQLFLSELPSASASKYQSSKYPQAVIIVISFPTEPAQLMLSSIDGGVLQER